MDKVSAVLSYLSVLRVLLSVDGLVTTQQETTYMAEGCIDKNEVNIK